MREKISAQVLGLIEREEIDLEVLEGAFFFREGWNTLVNRLADPLKKQIHLNRPVKRISWKAGQVSVECMENKGLTETFRARSVLITVPLGVLQASHAQVGSIQWTPDLPPQKNQALSKLKMSEALRITYQFKEPLWEQLKGIPKWALLFDVAPQSKLRTWWARGRLLTGWIGGPEVRLWTDLSEKTRRDYGVQAIARIFGLSSAVVDRSLETSYVYDWSSDPYSRGVYHYVLVGGLTAQRSLAEPVEGTLFFAGEATHPGGYSGTANGAIISGVRAAKEILEALKKKS